MWYGMFCPNANETKFCRNEVTDMRQELEMIRDRAFVHRTIMEKFEIIWALDDTTQPKDFPQSAGHKTTRK